MGKEKYSKEKRTIKKKKNTLDNLHASQSKAKHWNAGDNNYVTNYSAARYSESFKYMITIHILIITQHLH